MKSPTNWRLNLVFVAGLAAAVAVLWLILARLGMPETLSPGKIASWLSGQGPWGPALLVTMMVIAVIVGPIPTLPISAASGLAFGALEGTAIAVVGALIGAALAFGASRLLGRDYCSDRLRHNPVFSPGVSQPMLFWAVLVTRLIPLFSFALISYAAGLTAITLTRFLLASLIGMLPMTFVFAGLGQTFEFHPLITALAAGVLLLTMSLAPYYLQKRHSALLARWLGKSEP
ncbi:TVP38/TMEM64 family protein [Marinobacter caseinilyticus]|uniref:TVP38/TMEM64 family protein n=1 Tax=Marinobacter caseinilyticus TaxID=2692195 RepID=UPI00140C0E49|nr:TVP38/TMEM64 family protein [Marinobacter caseinilyticus]